MAPADEQSRGIHVAAYLPRARPRRAASQAPSPPSACAQDASPGAQWLSYNNHLDGQRFSPLKQITPANAAQLGEVCRVQIDGPTSMHRT